MACVVAQPFPAAFGFYQPCLQGYRPNFSSLSPYHPSSPVQADFSALIDGQPWMQQGARGHPCVIVGVSEDGASMLCCQMTGFHNKDNQNVPPVKKWPDAKNPLRRQALPCKHNSSAPAHDGLPELEFVGTAMNSDSWVKVAGAFWIEACNLEQWRDGGCRLTPRSLGTLTWHVNEFLQGRIPKLPKQSKKAEGYQIKLPQAALARMIAPFYNADPSDCPTLDSEKGSSKKRSRSTSPALGKNTRQKIDGPASLTLPPTTPFQVSPSPIFVKPARRDHAVQIKRP